MASHDLEYILRLLLAGGLGAAIGLERKAHYKDAGVRTHFVLALGSALVMIISKYGFGDVVNGSTIMLDPSRVAAQVVSGIGFLGAGLIIFRRNSIHGLTTAAGMWTTAGIGLAVGSGFYVLSIVAALLVLFGYVILKQLEQKLVRDMLHITLTSEDRPGVMGRIGSSLGTMGISIHGITMNRADADEGFIEIELTLRIHEQRVESARIVDALMRIEGVRQVDANPNADH